jgi:hypothetical protein
MGLLEERLDYSKFGIFADSEALGSRDEMEVRMNPDYLEKSRSCEMCNNRIACQMSWAEIYCLQNSVWPHEVGRAMGRPDLFRTQWVYNEKFKCFHPVYRCSCTSKPDVIFDMTPTEAQRVLTQAGQNGIISHQQQQLIHAVRNVVSQFANKRAARRG